MPSCLALGNLLASCNSSRTVGGLQTRILFANKSQITDISLVTVGVKTGAVDAITMITGAGARFWEIESVYLQNAANSAIVSGVNNFYTQSISIAVRGMNQETVNILDDMILADLVFIVQTRNLNNAVTPELETLLYGYQNGLRLPEGTMATGQAFEDIYGSSLTFSGAESSPHKEIVPAAGTIAAFLAALLVPVP